MKAKNYKCFYCNNINIITSFWKWLRAPHLDPWHLRYFKCDHCGKKGWMKCIKDNDNV